MSSQIGALSKEIQHDNLPATLRIVKLKTHIGELYKQLGYDDKKAEYQTLVECGEFEHLGPVVSTML